MGSLYKLNGKGNWQAQYRSAAGKFVRRSTKTKNRMSAEKILRGWEAEAHAIEHGIELDVDLGSLVKEYGEFLGNDDPKHVQYTKNSLNRIFDHHGWTQPKHITQFGAETAVRQFKKKNGKQIGLRTQAHYLGAAKAFTKWLRVVRKIIAVDPLEGVKKPNPQKGRLYVRRFLLHTEWEWLRRTPNALLYATAIQTGLRANELRRVKQQHLIGTRIELPSAATKNKLAAKQNITAELAKDLHGALPFRLPPEEDMAEMLRDDLAIARELAGDGGKTELDKGFLQPTDARGHHLDFHALRHTCGAWLAIAGVQPKIIQAIMRHSTITLTLDTYGHLLPGAEEEAVAHFSTLECFPKRE